VEQWYALAGLEQVAQVIRTQSTSEGATVIEQLRPWWYYSRLPEDALHQYLWDQPQVRFVESSALSSPSACELRMWMTTSEPVFLVVNGADNATAGAPPGVVDDSQRLESALRDIPEAMEVLRIKRPSAPNWLSLVRVNARPQTVEARPCTQ
jgi:hypothetical protein